MKKLLAKTLLMLSVFALVGGSEAKAQADMEEVMTNLQESLDLSDKQVTQVQNLMVQYRAKLDGVLLKYEDEEEPDVGKMIGEIRDVRDGYRKDLQGILSKDQYDGYIAMIDSILTDMFNDLAEIRLMDIQPQVDLTDGQVESLIPILGKSLLSTVRLLFENAGTRLSVPKKISIGKNLKKIEKEKRAGMENILTPEQLAAYDKYKEEQKAARKGK
jgi:Spy/CpxP family protein refolding chaperone